MTERNSWTWSSEESQESPQLKSGHHFPEGLLWGSWHLVLGSGRLEASWAQPRYWVRGWGSISKQNLQIENIGDHVSQQASPAG